MTQEIYILGLSTTCLKLFLFILSGFFINAALFTGADKITAKIKRKRLNSLDNHKI